MTEPDGIRLQKVLAAAGIGSRRACEGLIEQGRVSVNDDVVKNQGRRVDPEVDVIRVDTMRINTARGLVYLAMNKPKGYITAMSDPEGRPTIGDLVRREESEMLKFRNFGRKSLLELVQVLEERGLRFGMDVERYGEMA